MERTLTLDEVCVMLKIAVPTGRNRICLGLPMPPSIKPGRRHIFFASAVEKWMQNQAGLAPESRENDQDRQSRHRRKGC